MKLEIQLEPDEFARLERVSSFCGKASLAAWAKAALLDCAEISELDMIFGPDGELIGDALEIHCLEREVREMMEAEE